MAYCGGEVATEEEGEGLRFEGGDLERRQGYKAGFLGGMPGEGEVEAVRAGWLC